MYWSLLVGLTLATVLWLYHLNRNPRIHRHGKALRYLTHLRSLIHSNSEDVFTYTSFPRRTPPNTLPILGNAIKFIQPRHILFDWFVECQREFGHETLQISVPTLPPGVMISSPDNLEFVLKNESVITKGEFFKKRSWDLFGKWTRPWDVVDFDGNGSTG
jgi:hypothetical protein